MARQPYVAFRGLVHLWQWVELFDSILTDCQETWVRNGR
jgi:uncharacterized protein (DUF2252 family)